MLKNGLTSGCLTVISNDFERNHQKLLDCIKTMAFAEWNKLEDWYIEPWFITDKNKTFETFYKLTKKESQLHLEGSDMPESFLGKYYIAQLRNRKYRFIKNLPNVLYHEKKPNTEMDLLDALKAKEVYEVRCNTCNRTYFADEKSITCVKWQSCCGAECLSSTVENKPEKYINLCSSYKQSNELQIINKQMPVLENISEPLSYYGKGDDISISYISDIHLLHHLNNGESKDKLIDKTVKSLYESLDDDSIIVFGGDISSEPELTIKFYERFATYNSYLSYKDTKSALVDSKEKKILLEDRKHKLENKVLRYKKHVESIKEHLLPELKFSDVEQYKNKYKQNSSWFDTINAYKKVDSYRQKSISEEREKYLDLLSQKMDLLDNFEEQLNRFQALYDYEMKELSEIESDFGNHIESVSINDLYRDYSVLSERRNIYAVLGNHEYIGFSSVKAAVEFYRPRLEALGIKLLHNESEEIEINGTPCVVFGGTGFAKYNNKYNAETIVACNGFTREDEIKETTEFETAYLKAKQIAKKDACFICISHYPVSDCFVSIDKDTIYFYGHNHQNYYRRNENEIIYADNQIGYEQNNILFKTMTTGVETNPYFALEDGLYKTTIPDYLQFNRHIGEYIGEGTLLYQRCQNNKANMYVIKLKGYYGFFIMNSNKGTSQGISIVNGGSTKKISKSTDLQWLYDNFETVLCRYLQVLTPLREYQEQISSELKQLGFSGTIHGCIVDIDYYHHIMLNPIDGTITYYYSPSFGLIRTLDSFDNVIDSIESRDKEHSITVQEYKKLKNEYNKNKTDKNYTLGLKTNSNLLDLSENKPIVYGEDIQTVSRSEGMYGLSRRINPLQKLFSGRVLRDYNSNLAKTEPK